MLRISLAVWFLFFPLIACSPASNEHMMVIGNSITRHAPAPELGWYGDWGMAATAEGNDWVHIVLAEMPTETQLTLVHCTAPNLRAQVDALITQVEEAEPTLLVIQVGDNLLPEDATEAALYEPIRQIAEAATGRVIIIGIWGANDVRNTLLKRAATDASAGFVPIHDLREVPEHQAGDDFGGGPVGWHPSDLGMEAIAWRVLEEIHE
jgi:hypothetical protein